MNKRDKHLLLIIKEEAGIVTGFVDGYDFQGILDNE
jgi:hypothetical protein